MLRRVFQRLSQYIKSSMASALEAKSGEKRAADELGGDICKKQKGEQDAPRADRKRKVALLIAYNGKGYYGLQLNPGFPTIESEVLKALLAVEVIPQQHHDCPQKMSFQRAARTDKGVSAAGNLVSLKMLLNVDNMLDKINEHLPPQVRVFECVRTTNGFNCKNHCSGRTYIYLLPTYAFAPVEEICTLEYRTNLDVIERVNEVLEKFVGTHNFHNFTSGIKPTEGCAKRYIKQFECRMPFVHNGVEFCVLSVMGQSFMMHQIRKMVGLTIAIVRGFANIEAVDEAWKHDKMDIPKAPGLGLMLDKLHYDQYNQKWASDGSHEKIDFKHLREKLDKFKEEYIFSEIMKEEIETQSMMQWLAKLHYHTYSSEAGKWSQRKGMEKKLREESSDTSEIENQTGQSSKQIENQTGQSSKQIENQTGQSSKQIENQTEQSSKQIENQTGQLSQHTDTASLENFDREMENKDENIKADSELSAATENISDTGIETVSAHQNKTTDEIKSSEFESDTEKVDKGIDSNEKEEDQSNEVTKMKTGSSG